MDEEKLQKELDNAIDTSGLVVEWNQDPVGYFTIKPFPERGRVYVRFYDKGSNPKHTFSGTNTSQIIQEILKMKLVSSLGHAAYLGKEIEKALIALRSGSEYIQDDDLKL